MGGSIPEIAMTRNMLILAALASVGTAAAASSPPGPEAQQQAVSSSKETAKSEANKVVCRKFPPPPGTRLGARRICKTNAEWDLLELDQFQALDQVQRKPFQAN